MNPHPHRTGCFLLLGDHAGLDALRARLDAERPVELASRAADVALCDRAVGIVLAAPPGEVSDWLPIVRAGLLADAPLLVVTDGCPGHGLHFQIMKHRGRLLARSDWIECPDGVREIVDGFASDALEHERMVVSVRASIRVISKRKLTPKQMQVAQRAVSGRSRKEIALDLGLAESTVRNQISRILVKCGIPGASIAQLRRVLERAAESGVALDDDDTVIVRLG